MSPRKSLLRLLSVLVCLAFVASACAGSGSENAEGDEEGLGQPVPDQSLINLDEVPTADPSIFEPAPSEGDEQLEDGEVYVITAQDDATFIDTFREPNGEAYNLEYEYLNGDKINYPLQRDTVFGNRLALQVVEGGPSDTFVKVKVPVRPNGTETWVQGAWFDWNRVDHRVVVDVGANTVTVYKGDEVVGDTPAAVGREGRETPLLTTYIDEKIQQPNADGGYGPWIISLAAFSDVLQDFEGKLPKLAIHGTNQPELIGDEVSSGCIRVENEFITMIAEDVPVGSTVEIIDSSQGGGAADAEGGDSTEAGDDAAADGA